MNVLLHVKKITSLIYCVIIDRRSWLRMFDGDSNAIACTAIIIRAVIS